MRTLRMHQVFVAAFTLAVLLITPGTALFAAGVDEIVVTARKKAEDLQTVPLSISAFSGEDMTDRGIENLADLAALTPGLEFNSTGSITSDRPIIRGLSQQTRVGDEPNVASFVDGVYAPGFTGSTLLFDSLGRVEVIRGPQSAVYGRNSFAGAINYVSKKPSDKFDIGGRATLGADDKQALSGYVSGPIIKDYLTVRLDAAYRDTGGTIKNAIDGEPLGARETEFVRFSVQSTLGPVQIDASGTYSKDEVNPQIRTKIYEFDPRLVGHSGSAGSPFEIGFVAWAGQPLQTRIGRRFQGEINDVGDVFSYDPAAAAKREGTFWTLGIDWNISEAFSLVSTSGYLTRDVRSQSDVDATVDGGVFNGSGIVDAPLITQTTTGSQEDRDQISTDLRLSYDGGGRLTWLIGAYYSQEDFSDQRIRSANPGLQRTTTVCPPEIFGSAPCLVDYAYPQLSVTSDTVFDDSYYAVFGGFDLDLTTTLALAVEARQTRQVKKANNTLDLLPSNSIALGDLGKQTFNYFTPRVNLSWQVTSDTLFYALVAKGVKSGGFNGAADFPEDERYDLESNWTYEVGGKSTFWDQRARVNLAAYYIDWEDQQITLSQLISNSPITGNIASSQVKGFEVEITLIPVDPITLNIGYSFTDAEYKDAIFKTSQGWVDCVAIGTIECTSDPIDGDTPPPGVLWSSGRGDGNQLVGSARHMVNLGAEYQQPINVGDWDAFFRGDYAYRSKRYIDGLNIGWTPSRSTVNIRLGLRDNRWNVEGFCENLFDDDEPGSAFVARDFLGVPHPFVVNRNGRICGLTVGFRYL